MAKEIIELIRFTLERSASEPVQRRVALLRGLAEICGDEAEAKNLAMLADEFQKAESRFADFVLSFSQQNPQQ